MDAESLLFSVTILAGLGQGCYEKLRNDEQCAEALIRTESLTCGNQGNRDLMTFSELCSNWNQSDMILYSGINTMTCAVSCNSAVWVVLLCVSAYRHRVPFLGIQPSSVLSKATWNKEYGEKCPRVACFENIRR